MKIYERSNFVQLGHRDSRTLEAARKRVPMAGQTKFTVYRHKVFDFECGWAVIIEISD